MTAPVSLLPPMSGALLPPATPLGLSDDEQRLVTGLSSKLSVQYPDLFLRNAYYNGEQRLRNLGISVPPALAGVHEVVDWPRVCIDPVLQRCEIDGFRMPKQTDTDTELQEHWNANDMAAEFPLALLDALVYRCGYGIVGTPDTSGDSPLITVESPMNLATTWDPRTRQVTAAYQSYEVEGLYRAVLYLPNETVFMSRQDMGGSPQWSVDNRDRHKLGEVPVVRIPNRARTGDREGRSEITPAVMATTDSACRTLLGMEIGREFYSIPHKYAVGLSETDFVDSAGNPKSAMDMAISKFLVFQGDGEHMPTVSQFTAMDPSVFTKIIDTHAQLMASYTGFPPAYFGLTSTTNPASADAIRVALDGLVNRTRQVQRESSGPARKLMQLTWRIANGGAALPAEMRQLETDWSDPTPPTPQSTSQAVTMQTNAGIIPPTSDVTLQKLGWSSIQRQRLAQDRDLDPMYQLIQELGSNVAGKDIIGALRLLKATGQPVPRPDPSIPVDGTVVPPATPAH